jgi:hypothetical protein
VAKKSNTFLGWLGRQVGHVKGAIKTDVPEQPKVLYQKKTVHEAALPDRPDEKLRRTVIDEVVREPKKSLANDDVEEQ